MAQLLLIPDAARPVEMRLPPLEIEPITLSIGQIRHVIRSAVVCEVAHIGEVQVSSKTKESLYKLPNGETIIITKRPKVERPKNVDGVLRQNSDGQLKWISHRLRDSFADAIVEKGLPAVAKEIARTWDGAFSFRQETKVSGVKEVGLRMAQIGALHAIGAHWSLHRQPATVVMPTGTGKTETMLSTLAAYVRGPLLVAVPSEILRTQTAKKFLHFGLLRELKALSPDSPNPIVGIVTKRARTAEDLGIFSSCNVIIGTMSALGEGEASAFSDKIATLVDTLIVDEAHHVGAEGWGRFREAFKDRRILQFTATPFRRDGKLVDGEVIFDYPLRMAQKDGYFKKIVFDPIYEIDDSESDRAIAEKAIAKVRADIAAGYNHLVMARCTNIDRARAVYKIYEELAPDLRPMLVHSELTDTDSRIEQLRAGQCRIAICVNMLGEGFDLPQLKIAAIHDLHKSLGVLLQFVGRFTRTADSKIGDATIVANIADPDVTGALERLYSEDADWNQVLSEMSSDAAKEHAELVEFLKSSERLDEADDETLEISHQLLRPTLGTLFYEATQFRPKKFHEGLPKHYQVQRVWFHPESKTLFFVTKSEPTLKWSRSKALRDREWAFFVLHYDAARKLLYLSSSDHSSLFDDLARAVGATKLIAGDQIFRSLGHINRLIFQNVGVKKHGRRNLRYAMYTGADVAEALSLSERAGSVKNNLSGTGWEDGRPVSIGCSYKGRVWTREQGPVPRLVKWCEQIGAKIIDPTIDTKEIIANVLIPEEQNSLPDKQILGLEWPVELLAQSEERILLTRDGQEQPLSMFDLRHVGTDLIGSALEFEIVEATTGVWVRLEMKVGGDEGFVVSKKEGPTVLLKVGSFRKANRRIFLKLSTPSSLRRSDRARWKPAHQAANCGAVVYSS